MRTAAEQDEFDRLAAFDAQQRAADLHAKLLLFVREYRITSTTRWTADVKNALQLHTMTHHLPLTTTELVKQIKFIVANNNQA
jgi:hypothetical protein